MVEKSWRFRRSVPVVLGVLVACLGLHTTEAPGGPKTVKPCISPTQVNLNERWGISDAIVAPFCTEVNSGRRWVVSNAWFVNPTFDSVPPGFVAAGATPVEDFIAKFVGVKYVVVPERRQFGRGQRSPIRCCESGHARLAKALERWRPRGRFVLGAQRHALRRPRRHRRGELPAGRGNFLPDGGVHGYAGPQLTAPERAGRRGCVTAIGSARLVCRLASNAG